jgi:hypothetical protein
MDDAAAVDDDAGDEGHATMDDADGPIAKKKKGKRSEDTRPRRTSAFVVLDCHLSKIQFTM